MMKGKVLLACLVLGVLLGGFILSPSSSGKSDDQAANRSAKTLAGEWRYPAGEYVSTQPDRSDATCIEWATVDAGYDDVLSFFLKRCGRDKLDGPVFESLAPGGKGNAGHTMVACRKASEIDFARHTGQETVHVTIRQVDNKRTEIKTFVGVR
jgi:hypothetical protein